MAVFDPKDPEASGRMRDMFGPGQVDQQIRQAIQFCWMMLPEEQRTVEELEKQMRRIFDRAIKDLREDVYAFKLGE